MTRTWGKSAAVVCVLGLSVSAGRAEELHLAGSESCLWLVQAEDATFDVAGRPLGKEWTWSANGIRGRIVATAAIGDTLHVLLRRGGHLIFPPASPNRAMIGPNLHAAPVAACAAPAGFAGADAPSLLVVASIATPASSAPATRDAQGESGIYQNVGNDWRMITEIDRRQPGSADGVLLATTDRSIYLLYRGQGNHIRRLARWTDGEWSELKLKGLPTDAEATAMTALGDKVVLILAANAETRTTTGPADQKALLVAAFSEVEEQWTSHGVEDADGRATWPSDRLPLVGRLGDRLAFVWQDAGKMLLTTCALDARLLAPTEIALPALPTGPMDGQRIRDYFLWAVLLATLMLVVSWRPKTPPKPFVLAEGYRPASLGKRLGATVIDFMPFSFMGTAIFAPHLLTSQWTNMQQAWKASEQFMLSRPSGYWTIFTFVSYCLYGSFMEARFGATLGKMIFKLRVTGIEGKAADVRGTLLRNLVKVLEFQPLLLPLVALIVILSRNRQRLGDLMGRTAVIDASVLPPPGPGRDESIPPPDPPPAEQ